MQRSDEFAGARKISVELAGPVQGVWNLRVIGTRMRALHLLRKSPGDPFIFFQHKQIKYVVMSDLEIDRAKKQAHADRVLSLSLYQRKLRESGKQTPTMVDILDLLFRERSIRSLIVPANFPALLADQLRAKRPLDQGLLQLLESPSSPVRSSGFS